MAAGGGRAEPLRADARRRRRPTPALRLRRALEAAVAGG